MSCKNVPYRPSSLETTIHILNIHVCNTSYKCLLHLGGMQLSIYRKQNQSVPFIWLRQRSLCCTQNYHIQSSTTTVFHITCFSPTVCVPLERSPHKEKARYKQAICHVWVIRQQLLNKAPNEMPHLSAIGLKL